jgi:hypothetical protein
MSEAVTDKITAETVEQQKTIIIVTTDKLGMTGEFSWKFLFAENQDRSPVLPSEIQNIACGLPFGYLWEPESRGSDDDSRAFNFFEAGKGLCVGGGFEKFNDRSNSPFRSGDYDVEHERERHANWQKEMLDNIPASIVLMKTSDFQWLQDHILEASGRHYLRYHCDQPLFTS